MSARRVMMASVCVLAVGLGKFVAPPGKSTTVAPAAPGASSEPLASGAGASPASSIRAPEPSRGGPAPHVSKEAVKIKEAFESEIRSANADVEEKKIEDAFQGQALPAGLLSSVSCHPSVCRASINWSRSRLMAVMSVTTRLMRDFGPQVALEPVGELGPDNTGEMRLYLPRRDVAGPLARSP